MTALGYLREMGDAGYTTANVGAFHRVMLPFIAASVGVGPEERVVDIGAGHGHGLLPLWERGFRRLVAVDREPDNFTAFRERYGIEGVLCDVEKQTVDLESGCAGMVMCLHLIEHLWSAENLLRESFRLLRNGGVLFVVTPDWRKQYRIFYRDPTHVRPYDRESLARLLKIHQFRDVATKPWGTRWGLGRLQAYRLFPAIGLMGQDILALARKS